MLVIDADHVAEVAGGEAIGLLAIPALWIIGVVVLVAVKLRSP
jgi:hypothetical protein